jgi:hypothetical protein
MQAVLGVAQGARLADVADFCADFVGCLEKP